jgi:surface carbohydrate biosynthesis protein
MSNDVDIVYFIEHAARELDVACAVKSLLARQGIRMEICSIVTGLGEALARWIPKVVAIPYGTSVKDTNLEPLVSHWGAARYVNLSFEQVLGKTQKSFKAPKDTFARQHLVYTAWGDFFVDYLQEYSVPVENITVVGNPALALYTLPYRNYYGQARAELAQRFGLSLDRRWVFVPENYGWAFFKDNNVRDRIRRGFNPEDAFRYRDFALASLKEAAIWWREAAKLKDVELILRPRPAIPTENFHSAVLEFAGEIPKHLRIIKHGTVREWTLASDLIFSSYSTTLLDAALADRPVYMLTPYPIPEFLFAEWYGLTAKVSSFDEFAAAIQADPLEANWDALQSWVRQQMMSRGDAIFNLSDSIVAVVRDEHSLEAPTEIATALQKPSLDRAWRKFRRFGWNFWQSALALVNSSATQKGWNPHEKDVIDPQDIAQRVARWGKVLGD